MLRATGRIMKGGGAGSEVEGQGRKRRTSGRGKEREDEKKTKGRIPNLFHRDRITVHVPYLPISVSSLASPNNLLRF